MYKNDSTYRGNAQNNGLVFLSPIAPLQEGEDEFNRNLVYLSEINKQKIMQYFKRVNDSYQLGLPMENDLTSYDNPDYLWLQYELNHLRELYNLAMVDPISKTILPDRKLIPYVQLRLKAEAYSIESRYPKSTLNCYGKEYKPHYVVEFDKAFLKAFMDFIFMVFDDNPQQYVEIENKKIITYQHKAPIYRMPPFDKYFSTRHDIPGIIFPKAVQMLLAHELAHVGCGHLDLQVNNPIFGRDPDTLICEEDNADKQAICWVLGERFLEMEENKLQITLNDLFQEMSLSIFAVYMLFTWDYSKEDRKWSVDVAVNSNGKSHLPYQLRIFNILNTCYARLINLGKWSEEAKVISLDNQPITTKFMESIYEEAINMIYSFEHSYHMFFTRTENVCKLFEEGNVESIREIMNNELNETVEELSKEYIPWLLGFECEAQVEIKRVHSLWEVVRERLIESGTYCKLAEFKPWEMNEE